MQYINTYRAVLICLLPVFPAHTGAVTAETLPRGVDVLHYRFDLSLPDEGDEITGTAHLRVRFTLSGRSHFEVDLVGRSVASKTGMIVSEVLQDGRPIDFNHRDDHIRIPLTRPSVAGEERTYRIQYRGTPEDGLIIARNKHGDRTFFGDNWPDRARYWLPVVDHPSDKATVEFIVTAPDAYQVIANGRLIEETSLPDHLKLTHWSSTVPLPTKVMVIGAARFAVEHRGEVGGVPVESWVYTQDRAPGFADFAPADSILAFFVRYIGPYPFEKLANVQSTTRYGGMENAGAIFYTEDAITGRQAIDGLLAHEIAHQWFGDAVTESDWPHIWLSEGFATYFAALYHEARFGAVRLREEMEAARRAVIRFSAGAPHTTVVDTTITDLNTLLSPISYQKGAWVLHMLRQQVGDSLFQAGIQSFYTKHRNRNAGTEDFRLIMEEVSGRNLGPFFSQWLRKPGQPRLTGSWTYNNEKQQVEITIEQVQQPLFRFPLEIGIEEKAGQARLERIEITDRKTQVALEAKSPPVRVSLDPRTVLLYEGELRKR